MSSSHHGLFMKSVHCFFLFSRQILPLAEVEKNLVQRSWDNIKIIDLGFTIFGWLSPIFLVKILEISETLISMK